MSAVSSYTLSNRVRGCIAVGLLMGVPLVFGASLLTASGIMFTSLYKLQDVIFIRPDNQAAERLRHQAWVRRKIVEVSLMVWGVVMTFHVYNYIMRHFREQK